MENFIHHQWVKVTFIRRISLKRSSLTSSFLSSTPHPATHPATHNPPPRPRTLSYTLQTSRHQTTADALRRLRVMRRKNPPQKRYVYPADNSSSTTFWQTDEFIDPPVGGGRLSTAGTKTSDKRTEVTEERERKKTRTQTCVKCALVCVECRWRRTHNVDGENLQRT